MLGKGSVYEIKFTARACDVRISFTYMDLSPNTVLKVSMTEVKVSMTVLKVSMTGQGQYDCAHGQYDCGQGQYD